MKRNLLFFVLAAGCLKCLSQTISKDILTKRWDAYWITVPGTSPKDYGVYHFRKTFVLTVKPSSFSIHVSADNRYKLFVNGTMVSLGSARADVYHWNYETVDIAGYLQVGDNVISAVVWNYGDYKPEHQISFRTGFILQGDTEEEKVVNTNSSWKCIKDSSYGPLQPDLIYSYYVAGPGEKIDYAKYPGVWENNQYNDEAWTQAKQIVIGLPKGVFQSDLSWMLIPRSIPQVELTTQRLQKARSVTGINLPTSFPSAKSSFTVPANTSVKILLDNGVLTNAYPVLQFSKGKDAGITLGYAEALYIDEGSNKDWKAQNKKGNRNEVEGKRFVGVKDEFIADGYDHTFTSLAWRTYRYMQLEVKTKDEPLIIDDLYGIFTGYPFELKAKFTSNNDTLEKIFETGWRTARLDAVETYMDCPYYEQLQYVGDTRIQAMVSLYNTGDDQLMRNAITQIDYSRMAEGITLSRFPTANAQEIPTFSLWWIGMLNDYYMYRNDPSFVKQFLPGERQVLQFFSKYQQPDGSLKNAPYWEFTDWANGKGWQSGMPPLGSDGSSAALDLQLLWAYEVAARLEDSLGMKVSANEYKKRAAILTETVKRKYWDNTKQLFADTKEKNYFSQHTNTLAILTNTIKGEQAKQLAKKMITDTSLTQATIYFQYYVNQALRKTGFGDLYLNRLQIWKDNLAMGLTTWAEISDINAARSDCHAWGASPNIEFFRTVLGIDTDAPGFTKIKIEPHLGELKKVSGFMPHPNGEIKVSYNLNQRGKLEAVVSIPKGTNGVFVWKGKEHVLKSGETRLLAL
ncbi:Bacterial alpha-L-rhamnosidase [Ginsengibacter hankyongi]|uniref:Bacterial alpha-L-rhamnosidase n=1 Tax=Ginsengibacter hankyongi TaxID=2607284 RepID=A0A5J5IIJ0_9BACT|nr:alpha-L-rhamnosidase C-terminal domain-containing protein [Ginsengibacter hankyongi]KAA9039398.1 Bacterial alpha-L-rhamnosidase [Ginsengibacter hankyongi]